MDKTENIKIIWTDIETGEQKTLSNKDYTMAELWEAYGSKVAEAELIQWENLNQVKIPKEIPPDFNLNKFMETIESELMYVALETTGGNKKEAAKLLGMQRTTLTERLKKKSVPTTEAAEITRQVVRDYHRGKDGKISSKATGADIL